MSADRASAPSGPDVADDAVFAEQRQEIDRALDEAIGDRGPVALLHYPYDGNVGNHMMWVATTDYLASRGLRVGFAAHTDNLDLDALRRAVGTGPILFLGGVTLSRLWPQHAEAKRRVADAFPDNPLVSLPATCLLLDDEDRRHAAEIFGDHPAVVMVREERSAAEARAAFPAHVRVVQVPDLALRLARQPRRGTPVRDVLWLARQDPEATGAAPPPDVEIFDWPSAARAITPLYLTLRVSGVFSRARSTRLGSLGRAALEAPIASLYRRGSRAALHHGNRVLDRGRVLVTDRMHPHIHAALRGQQVVLLPDRYGKNRAVYDDGTCRLSTVHWADTPVEALALARALAAGTQERR